MPGDESLDELATVLRLDAADVPHLGRRLVEYLEVILPNRARVDRRRKSLLSREQIVRGLSVSIGGDRFEIDLDDAMVSARRVTIVRGVAIRSEELTLPSWLGALRASLATEADGSASDRAALERLTTLR